MQQSPKLLYVGALPTHFAIFSNTLGEGSERSLIGKITARISGSHSVRI
jgi:hypothetical protein